MDCIQRTDYGGERACGTSFDGWACFHEGEALQDGLQQKPRLGVLTVVKVTGHPLALQHPLALDHQEIA